MTENEMNDLKAMMRAMEWQVNVTGKDSRKIYRSAVMANLTAFVIVGAVNYGLKQMIKNNGSEVK